MYRCTIYDDGKIINKAHYKTEEDGRAWGRSYRDKKLVSENYQITIELIIEHPLDLRQKEYDQNNLSKDRFLNLLMDGNDASIDEFKIKRAEINAKYPMRS